MTNSLSHNNNRDVNLPNINNNNASTTSSTSAIPNAIKKNYRRSQHVKVLKNCRQNSTRRQCLKCKESSSNVEMLKGKVCQIEKLVNAIAETAQNMKNYSQRDNQPRKWKFGGIDLTNSSLEEIQNLVLETTSNIKILPPSSSSNSDVKDISNTPIKSFSSSTTTRKQTIDLSSAAAPSSELITKKPLHSEPVQSIEEEGSTHPSHRHCRILPSHFPSNHENQASRQDSGFSESRQNTDPKAHHHHHHHHHQHQNQNKQQQDHN